MKIRLYVLVPAVAFALILANAFYGHSIFASNHPEDISKFSIYVHLQPEWDSHPGNLLFDVTNVWNNEGSFDGVYYDELSSPPALDGHNFNRLQHVGDRSFVELKHRFDDCQSNWQPILYRYGIDMLRNQFDAFGGADASGHPYAVMYPNSPGSNLFDHSTGYVQFIPICSSQETTSYQYSIKSNDPDLALSVFFVPDQKSYERFIQNPSPIEPTYGGECAGESYTSFSGKCENVPQNGGLLVWVPDDLELALTKITVNLREI